jgi:protein Tex
MSIAEQIAAELSVRPQQVDAAIALLDGGATVPFVARYRKEATGGLDDTALRRLEERLGYLRELDARRRVIVESIRSQGKLTFELEADLAAAETKARLEDLYLPYRPKRRTKAAIAREAGLEPLALALLADPSLVPESAAAPFIDPEKGVADVAAALDGARHILMERLAEQADLLAELREYAWSHGRLQSRVVAGKEQDGLKFSDYFETSEAVQTMPSHRALALFRGRREGILRLALELPGEDPAAPDPTRAAVPEGMVARHGGVRTEGPAGPWLRETVRLAWKVKLQPHLEVDVQNRVREAAETEAIRVFGRNLHDLLLAAPAGPRITMGLDPGIRTGVKVAVVDGTGRLLETATIYPHPPRNDWEGSIAAVRRLVTKHRVDLVSIGNGTASRETDRLVADLQARHPELNVIKVMVSEAGASVYSASEAAAREFPDLDVSLRGAVSIARRLQDPLAELVRIEPKSIGVGQYQHDVEAAALTRTLDAVVEDCVNAVGADVNMASEPLLARISGLNARLAAAIVAHRHANGPFRDRQQLLKVPHLGPRTFEQAAGFLRVRDGENPLDASAVHPESYPVVHRISERCGQPVTQLIGRTEILRALVPADFADARVGILTVKDILAELEKPGRDPRPEFRTAAFTEGVHEMSDLRPGMVLEGVVTNVANFGAFVDVGVHQDGLVHVSQLASRFVKDPRDVVKAGDIVRVKVLEVDLPRRRIGLTMKLETEAPGPSGGAARSAARAAGGRTPSPRPAQPRQQPVAPRTAMGAAFERLRKG